MRDSVIPSMPLLFTVCRVNIINIVVSPFAIDNSQNYSLVQDNMGLTICHKNEFVQSRFSDGFLNCPIVQSRFSDGFLNCTVYT